MRVANLRLLIGKTATVLRRDGIVAALRKALAQRQGASPADRAFDAAFGTDTGGRIPLWQLAIDSPNVQHGVHYQASSAEELEAALRMIAGVPGAFHFIDLGCGKGRTLLLAARFGFRAVTGIEFAPELVTVARANAMKLGLAQIAIRQQDAASFVFPAEDLIVYLYNPFGAAVLEKVIAALGEQQQRAPQSRVTILYKMPLCAALFDASLDFVRVGAVPGYDDILVWEARRNGAVQG